jgi:hypothetical protein
MRIIPYAVRQLAALIFFVTPFHSGNSAAILPMADSAAEPTSPGDVSSAPIVTGVTPSPGFVSELKLISLTFSEPVTGVRPGDFLINGVPAEGVSGDGASYTFSFPQPAFGPVDITWGTLHTIFDLDSPPNRFDPSTPGSSWA